MKSPEQEQGMKSIGERAEELKGRLETLEKHRKEEIIAQLEKQPLIESYVKYMELRKEVKEVIDGVSDENVTYSPKKRIEDVINRTLNDFLKHPDVQLYCRLRDGFVAEYRN